MSEADKPIISYGRRRRVKRELRKKDLAVVLTFILACVIAYYWGSITGFWYSANTYYWQQRCMNFAMPPGTAAYIESPASVAAVAGNPEYSRPLPQGPVIFSPKPLVRMNDWIYEHQDTLTRQRRGSEICFLHERATPSGERRLVKVEVSVSLHPADGVTRIVSLIGYSVRSGTLTNPIDLPKEMMTLPVGIPLTATDQFTLFVGQADSSDQSRFTIGYSLNGRTGTIRAILRDDGGIGLSPDRGQIVDGGTLSWTPIWRIP